jgi:hypothetical protein
MASAQVPESQQQPVLQQLPEPPSQEQPQQEQEQHTSPLFPDAHGKPHS